MNAFNYQQSLKCRIYIIRCKFLDTKEAYQNNLRICAEAFSLRSSTFFRKFLSLSREQRNENGRRSQGTVIGETGVQILSNDAFRCYAFSSEMPQIPSVKMFLGKIFKPSALKKYEQLFVDFIVLFIFTSHKLYTFLLCLNIILCRNMRIF